MKENILFIITILTFALSLFTSILTYADWYKRNKKVKYIFQNFYISENENGLFFVINMKIINTLDRPFSMYLAHLIYGERLSVCDFELSDIPKDVPINGCRNFSLYFKIPLNIAYNDPPFILKITDTTRSKPTKIKLRKDK